MNTFWQGFISAAEAPATGIALGLTNIAAAILNMVTPTGSVTMALIDTVIGCAVLISVERGLTA